MYALNNIASGDKEKTDGITGRNVHIHHPYWGFQHTSKLLIGQK